MLDKVVLNMMLEEYKKQFPEWFAGKQKEIYKWKAVKHFHDNWNPEAEDFASMLSESLKGTANLLESGNYSAKRRIKKLAEKEPTKVKQMFVELFDDTEDYIERVKAFAEKADKINDNYFKGTKSDQDKRTISTYLWLYDPEQYYIYKDTEFKKANDILGAGYNFNNRKKQTDTTLKNFLTFSEELNKELKKDRMLKELLKDNLTDDCDKDEELHTLTYDFIYFLSKNTNQNEQDEDNRKSGDNMDKISKNTILYGAPGTGKTYSTRLCVLSIIENRCIVDLEKEDKENHPNIRERYNAAVSNGQVVFTTFHQSYSYEDFIGGWRPTEDKESPLGYKLGYTKGVFANIAEKAKDNPDENFVIIIDEINRGQISKIFGELITLIEEDKRAGAKNELSVTLPNGDEFSVPQNLYIIGTMNTADKSISLIDVALRRRFEFIEYMPNADLVCEEFRDFFKNLNQNLKEDLKSTDLLIGHAYFMDDNVNFCGIMNNKVIPLLYEYYFDERDKVKIVLEKSLAGTEAGKEFKVSDNSAFGRLKIVDR